jgi:hypothetical protein
MSRLGVHRVWLAEILGRIANEFGLEAAKRTFETGDLTGELNDGHTLQMYSYTELRELLEQANCEVVAASAANFLTARSEELELDEERKRTLVEWDLEACRQSGTIDGGTHIIAVAQRH